MSITPLAVSETLGKLIAMRTVSSSDEALSECLQWCRTHLLADARSAEIGEIDGVPYLWSPVEDSGLLCFAHIDVVPVQHQSQWKLTQKGDRLYGRGTSDMKGMVLPALLALRELEKGGALMPVSILLTCDEEIGGTSLQTLLKGKHLGKLPPVAWTPDSGAQKGICCEHKAMLALRLTIPGAPCHSSMPWDGKNPFYDFADSLNKLRKKFPDHPKDTWTTTVTPTIIDGGTARNQVPDHLTCTLDVRYPQEKWNSVKELEQLILSYFPKKTKLERVISTSGMQSDPHQPVIQTYRKIARAVTRNLQPFVRVHGAADTRHFTDAGIPAFIAGPTGGGLHGPKEWVSLHSMMQHIEISKQLFQSLQ